MLGITFWTNKTNLIISSQNSNDSSSSQDDNNSNQIKSLTSQNINLNFNSLPPIRLNVNIENHNTISKLINFIDTMKFINWLIDFI